MLAAMPMPRLLGLLVAILSVAGSALAQEGVVSKVQGDTVEVALTDYITVAPETNGTASAQRVGQQTVENPTLRVLSVQGSTALCLVTKQSPRFPVREGARVSFEATSYVGRLTITSDPSGAALSLDGEAVGPAPQTVTRPAGRYRAGATLTGYASGEDSVSVAAGETRTLAFSLYQPGGWLDVASTPTGSEVFVEGVAVGATPQRLLMPPGTYQIEVQRLDYKPVRQTVTVASRQEDAVAVDLVFDAPPGQPPEWFYEQARAFARAAVYDRAEAYLAYRQARDQGHAAGAELLREVRRVRDLEAQLSPAQREELALQRRNALGALETGHRFALRTAADRVLAMIPRDPSALALLGEGLAQPVSLPAGPVLHFAYVFSASERPLALPPGEGLPPAEGFLLSTTEITNQQFAAFLNETQANARRLLVRDSKALVQVSKQWLPSPGLEQHPVSEATWEGARTYAAWAGGWLPTKAEWFWAFRLGLDGADAPLEGNLRRPGDERGGSLLSVRRFAPDGLGLYDMAGNAWEWVADEPATRGGDVSIVGGSFRVSTARALEGAVAALAPERPREVSFRVARPAR